MTSFLPSDAAERDRIRTDLDATLFVEAGAGTGKTTVLVARVVALVAAGRIASMERVVAITFTEAAAAELRGRVRRELERAARDPALDDVARARCRAAAGDVDLAAIQTIHAFAATLLRTYPLQAGLPPGFAVWDEVEAGLAFEESFRAWLYDDLPTQPAPAEALRRALTLGLSFDALRELAGDLQQQVDLLDPPPCWAAPAPPDPVALANRAGRALRELDDPALLGLAHDGDADPLVQEVRRAQPAARRLAAAADPYEALDLLGRLVGLRATVSRAASWEARPDGTNGCAHLKGILIPLRREVGEALAAHRTYALATLLGALAAFTRDDAGARRRRGAATFQDLLTWARNLLRDDADVRAQARARFSHVFVDEFQDTDPLQAELVWYLCAEHDGPDGCAWSDLTLAPGKLLVVGDPKQSIYRFRRADVGVYERVSGGVPAGDRLPLRQNWRSVPSILRWANHHFAMHMVARPGVQPPYVPLDPAVPEHDPAGVTHRVHVVGDLLDGRADEVWAAEAEAVAAAARRIVEERWPVRGEDGAPRDAEYRDLCVLLPTRTNLRRLERAMTRHGVPYRIESGALVLATQEVRDLLSCLRAIDDPSDQVALVAALRSPAYACSDLDLLAWLEAGGRLDYLDPGPGPAGPVADALASLKAFHAGRADLAAAATVDAFVRERMLAVQSFGHPRPAESWRRLRYVLNRARVLAAAGRTSLRALVDWLEDLQRADFRDVEEVQRVEVRHPTGPDRDPDDDAVRFLTVHGAKGLEFPVVLLTGLGMRAQSRLPSVLVDRATGQIEVRSGEFKTTGYEALAEIEKYVDVAERVRLLYVAATRARDHLVLSLYRGRSDSHASFVNGRLLAANPPLHQVLDLDAAGPAGPGRLLREDDAPTSDAHRADELAWSADRASLVTRLAGRPAVSATRLARRAAHAADDPGRLIPGDPLVDDDGPVPDDAPPDGEFAPVLPQGRGRTALGRAVHAALQAIDLRGGAAERAPIVDAAARAHGVPTQAAAVGHLVDAVLGSAPVRAALAARRYWREVPVGCAIDGVVLEGRIDLLYENADGALTVVDVKTDHVTRADLAARAAEHRAQGGAYALAVARATGRPVRAVELVFAALGGDAIVFDDVAPLAEQAAALAVGAAP